jgi:hypothetical protein
VGHPASQTQERRRDSDDSSPQTVTREMVGRRRINFNQDARQSIDFDLLYLHEFAVCSREKMRFCESQNCQLLSQVSDYDQIDLETVCSRFKKHQTFGVSNDEEAMFAALHFYELDWNDVKELDISVIERIVSVFKVTAFERRRFSSRIHLHARWRPSNSSSVRHERIFEH